MPHVQSVTKTHQFYLFNISNPFMSLHIPAPMLVGITKSLTWLMQQFPLVSLTPFFAPFLPFFTLKPVLFLQIHIKTYKRPSPPSTPLTVTHYPSDKVQISLRDFQGPSSFWPFFSPSLPYLITLNCPQYPEHLFSSPSLCL